MKKVLIFTLLFSLSVSFDVFSENNSQIDSPHGLFLVSETGVSQIHVVGAKDKDGDYEVKLYSLGLSSPFQKGELVSLGWWFSSSQQLNLEALAKALDGSQCKWWLEANWSYGYKPEILNITGKAANVLKETNNYIKSRAPKRTCNNYRFYKDNCERVRCNDWSDPKANSYLIRSKNDAVNYFYEITNK